MSKAVCRLGIRIPSARAAADRNYFDEVKYKSSAMFVQPELEPGFAIG